MKQPAVMVHLLFMVTLIAVLPLSAQTKSQLMIGVDAANLFVYRGRPVHPFCLDFPLENSSRTQPFELAKCSESRVVPRVEASGGLEAEYPTNENDFFISRKPGISYRVLGNNGERFLIATDSSGGGSGQFTALFWVRLDERQVVIVKDEIGGDRCAGGLSGYAVTQGAIHFSVNTPTARIIELAGVNLDSDIADKLNSGYMDCDGEAHYRYDLTDEKMKLTSLKFASTLANPADARTRADPQTCFNNLAQQYAGKGRNTLTPDELREFGRIFEVTCIGRKAKPR